MTNAKKLGYYPGCTLKTKAQNLEEAALGALRVLGIAPCRVDTRTRLATEVLDEVREFFGDRVLRTRVRTNIRLAEAPGHGRTIFEYDPACHGAEDYRALAGEILGDPPPEGGGPEEPSDEGDPS